MSRSRALLLTAALIGVGLASLGYLWLRRDPVPEDSSSAVAETVPAIAGPQAALYFPATSGLLEREIRSTPSDLDPDARKRWLAEQLVGGPQSENLRPALPAGTRLESVFTAPDGTVFVDFTILEAVGMGSTEEILALYSIVNTLLLDDGEARRAVILINGRQRDTLAGHVDTSAPLGARPDLIREAG